MKILVSVVKQFGEFLLFGIAAYLVFLGYPMARDFVRNEFPQFWHVVGTTIHVILISYFVWAYFLSPLLDEYRKQIENE